MEWAGAGHPLCWPGWRWPGLTVIAVPFTPAPQRSKCRELCLEMHHRPNFPAFFWTSEYSLRFHFLRELEGAQIRQRGFRFSSSEAQGWHWRLFLLLQLAVQLRGLPCGCWMAHVCKKMADFSHWCPVGEAVFLPQNPKQDSRNLP